jgi:hypothetical protein
MDHHLMVWNQPSLHPRSTGYGQDKLTNYDLLIITSFDAPKAKVGFENTKEPTTDMSLESGMNKYRRVSLPQNLPRIWSPEPRPNYLAPHAYDKPYLN